MRKRKQKEPNVFVIGNVTGIGLRHAIAVSRAGANVLFVGAFGSDKVGKNLKELLQRESIKCIRCPVKPGKTKDAKLSANDLRRAFRLVRKRDVILCAQDIPNPALLAICKGFGPRLILHATPQLKEKFTKKQIEDLRAMFMTAVQFKKLVSVEIANFTTPDQHNDLFNFWGPLIVVPKGLDVFLSSSMEPLRWQKSPITITSKLMENFVAGFAAIEALYPQLWLPYRINFATAAATAAKRLRKNPRRAEIFQTLENDYERGRFPRAVLKREMKRIEKHARA